MLEIVNLFKELHLKEYGGNGWHGYCFDACCEFMELLLEQGMIDKDGADIAWDLEHLNESKYSAKHPMLGICDHWIFRLNTTYYDWTLRQFIPGGPFPFIWTQPEI